MLSLITPWSKIPSYLIYRICPRSCYTFFLQRNFLSFTSKTSNTFMDPNVMGREIDLLETKDIRFRLPGNVGIFVNNDWLNKLQNLNDPANEIDNNLIKPMSHIELLNKLNTDKPLPNPNLFFEDKTNLHCEAHECPLLLIKDFQELFPRNNANLSNGLTVLTLTYKTENDMRMWSNDTDCEREQLLEKFVMTAKRMCSYLQKNGYWADFVDPSSGRPYYVIIAFALMNALKFSVFYST